VHILDLNRDVSDGHRRFLEVRADAAQHVLVVGALHTTTGSEGRGGERRRREEGVRPDRR
jgi:hypothetical protein